MSEFKKEAKNPADLEGRPTLGELFLAGPVLSICSPSFYRHAVKRSAFAALAFLVTFGLVVAVVRTAAATREFGEARAAIDEAFAAGDIPEVTIEDGVATVHASQPFVVVDDGRNLVVLDTTGQYRGTELITGDYESGMILTRDAIYSLDDQGRLTDASLAEIDQIYPFKIEFNATFLRRFVDLAQGFVLLGLFLWHGMIAPLYIALLALIVWGVATLFKRSVNFSAVLITGFFAAVPALYAEYLLRRIDVGFLLMYTLMLLVFWTVALVAAVGTRREGDLLRGMRSLRAWRSFIGVPMLIVFALEIMFDWARGDLIAWGVAVVTVVALVAVGYFTGPLAAPRGDAGKVAPQG